MSELGNGELSEIPSQELIEAFCEFAARRLRDGETVTLPGIGQLERTPESYRFQSNPHHVDVVRFTADVTFVDLIKQDMSAIPEQVDEPSGAYASGEYPWRDGIDLTRGG